MKKICPSCGVEAADDDAFCAKCGAKLVPSAPNPPETFLTPEQPEPQPTVPVERRAEPSADEKTVPFWNRPLELDPKKLGERIKPGLKKLGERIKPGLKKPGEWIGIGLVCALLLWFVYIPASVIWAYAWPDLRDDALWSFQGSRANGVRTTGFTWGGDPTVLMTVKHYEGLAKDYYFVAWDEEHERYVAVRCDETTFQRIKSEESFRLKGVVRTLHKEIAEDFKRYGKDLSWKPTLVLPGKCIDMTGMKGVGCLFLALALVILPFCCEAGYKSWKKTRKERRTARRCSNCGIRLDDNAKFCSSCGTPAPIERSPDPTEEESRRSSDDGISLPKPLLYFLGGIAALAFLVFYQRYWKIGWMKLSPDYSAHSTKYDKQNIPNGVVELGNGTMMVTGAGPRISDEDMEKLFKNLKNGGISRSGVINQQTDDDDLEDNDDDWEDDEEDEEDEEELDDDEETESATETLNEFFELFESDDPDDYYQLENYILFPTKDDIRKVLGPEEVPEDYDEKTVKQLKVMLRSGIPSLGWKEVQTQAFPASVSLTAIGGRKGQDGVVWVDVTVETEGIIVDDEKRFPLPMRKVRGEWKIDPLPLAKAIKDGTLEIPDWMR